MNIVLYTSGCPRCKVLEKKLDDKHIEYTKFTDVDAMIAKGFKQAPLLEVDGVVMDFKAANDWLKQQEANTHGN